jgi:DNA-binding CsgD family transcriptional regulator
LRELPSQTSTLLLIAASEPAARPEWLWAAAQHLGIDVDAATSAELAGLIIVNGGIRFRHALSRAASFVKVGADAFAHRARRELQATGKTVRARSTKRAVELTTQGSRIARLAREGYTDSEIAGQLFLSPRTVEWHLGRVFAKLGATSRREL